MNTYLDLEAELDGKYLHPGGRRATQLLLERLEGTSVLEIGCGTGATLSRLSRRFSLCFGLDSSRRMLRRAARRGSAPLVLGEAERLPFCDAAFDAVVAESVAALLDFEKALPEWIRVLKSGGTLALNDGLWREGLSEKRVSELTRRCVESFGQRMAPDRPETILTWTARLQQAGLEVSTLRLDPAHLRPPIRTGWARRWRKLRRPWLWPALLRHRRRFGTVDPSLIEFWVITARKPGRPTGEAARNVMRSRPHADKILWRGPGRVPGGGEP